MGVQRGFGLTFTCDFPLPGLPREDAGEPARLALRLASAGDVDRAWSGADAGARRAELVLDGLPYRAERGTAGDHRFAYADRASFHLSADARTLLCAPSDPSDPSWLRVLLDSVLATISLLQGFEALHAAAVAAPGGLVAFMGHTGGGKTTLACELVRRGLPLACDDVLALERDADGVVVGHPAPPLMNVPAGSGLADGFGTRIAQLQDEAWMAVDRHAREAAPVAAVCLLDRRPGLRPQLLDAGPRVLDLLAHGLRSGPGSERMQARFELLTDLAAQAPAYVLEADPSTTPPRLADLAEAGIAALRPVAAGAPR